MSNFVAVISVGAWSMEQMTNILVGGGVKGWINCGGSPEDSTW